MERDDSKKIVDIIIPCFNESEVLDIYFTETKKIVSQIYGYKFNFIFIDDGSKDNTADILKQYAKENEFVRYISFSRNFGKESAMYAGLKNSAGDYVLIMDADMQNPPMLIEKMLKAVAEEEYDCCSANRTRKGDPALRTYFSKNFYRLTNKISEVDMPDGAGDFRMMNRQMVNAIVAMSEVQRFSKGIFSWVGFKTKWVYFENIERAAGQTKWNFWKLFTYALDGITAFSTFPLRIASFVGAIISACSFIYLIYIIIKTIISGKDIPGYASTITLILFIGGIIILSCGILGEYISKIYMEVKNRPIYIIRETNIDKPQDDYK
ncbi:glycosyltransferase family 2 protein [Clostridium sp. BL-8]|uniref:glycosyltransferase family 2 protein n=1 Tax=Clostridium sp. BL-8 TaxID=349938 RepID=UPI00098C41EE|nr:glycosyltransferase family 2 protein [Clostridium sp. BL-8]OOM73837.1 putative glycosyltransferase CsbB [Clostridium sp. BL-8]